MPEAIPELVWFALLLFAFALVYVVRKFIQALFNPIISVVGHVPGLGGALSGALSSVEQSISNALGSVEHGIDKLMGASFHRFAELTLWLWREIKGHASLLAQIASFIPGIGNVVAALRALVHHSVHANTGTAAKVKTLEKELHGIEHQVKQLERDLTKGIGHDLRIHIKALEKELGHVEHKTIPAIQADVATADNAIGNLYDWIKGKANIIGVGTIATAVATALGALGLDWIKCREAKDLYNQRGCGMWSDLANLLGLAFIGAEIASLDELIGVAQTVTEDVVKGVEDLLQV